jgi:hypothetical protein
MKKLFIIFIVTSIFVTSCTEEIDITSEAIVPVPEAASISMVEYTMPFLSSNKLEVKAELLKITDEIVETKHKNYYKVTCIPTKSETNMFSSLSYEYSLNEFDFRELNFTYKLDKDLNISKENKEKLLEYLQTLVLK